MELQEIFFMQKGLDEHIEKKHQLENEDLFDRKILALLVELGELANETRCFKFWSLKAPSSRDIILEEFVDGIHFMLSLGIECGYADLLEVQSAQCPSLGITEHFLEVFTAVNAFRANRSLDAYVKMVETYLSLAESLGFTNEDIKQAYISKNEINYKRQHEGY